MGCKTGSFVGMCSNPQVVMLTFNTLQEILDADSDRRMTTQDLINRRGFVNGEWRDIEMSDELRKPVATVDIY